MAFAKGLFGCAFMLIALLQVATAVDTYVVLDNLGWTIPPGGPIAYTTWANDKEFEVGDTLVFNFTTNIHNVAQVTKAAFDACTKTNPNSLVTNGPANITLNTAGEHYFICTIGTHCEMGQKLAINVSRDDSRPISPGSPTTPTTPPSTSTPPSNTATPPSSTPTPPSGNTTPSTPPPTTPTTPSPTTGGPPSNAATSVVVVASSSAIFSLFFGLAFLL